MGKERHKILYIRKIKTPSCAHDNIAGSCETGDTHAKLNRQLTNRRVWRLRFHSRASAAAASGEAQLDRPQQPKKCKAQ